MTSMTKSQHGFTLIEAVIVIVITGAISAVVAMFIQAPIKGYFDSARRAELTDVADTALRRMSRDLHVALPNSIRTSGSTTSAAIEFLQTSSGGRYRSEFGTTTADDFLDFTQSDSSFELLGPPMNFAAFDMEHQNQIVIYNLGIPGASAYTGGTTTGDNRRAYNVLTGGATTSIQITPNAPFPFDSPNHSFHVVDTPVSYICDFVAGTLTRYSGYAIPPIQPTPPTGALRTALLAQNVSACAFTYLSGAPSGVTERSSLVAIRLSLRQSSETATLYHEVHVTNVP
ncbi:type II secretion system protein [soil metagenome]